jgi:hypothetical protein
MSKGGYWVPAQIDDEEIKYTYEPHSPVILKGVNVLYCKYCGLLYLKNPFTKWCIRMGCANRYHPHYNKMMEKFTGRRS